MFLWEHHFFGQSNYEYDEFFGLNEKYIASVYESFFTMKYFGGFSIFELYNLPIKIRQFMLLCLEKQLEKETEKLKEIQSKSKKK